MQRQELFASGDISKIVIYQDFDVPTFIDNVEKEKGRYKAVRGKNGKLLFTDSDVADLLYQRLIPYSLINELMENGLNKTQAKMLVMSRSDPKKSWDQIKAVRKTLQATSPGLKDHQATELALRWSNAPGVLAQRIVPAAQELQGQSISRTQAARLAATRKNDRALTEVWAEEFKPAYDELVKTFAPNEAMMLVTRYKNPQARAAAIVTTAANLKGVVDLTDFQLRRKLLFNKYGHIVTLLKSVNVPDHRIDNLLAPLR